MTLCIGWDEREGNCPNEAGSTHSELWCQECDDRRLAYITRQMESISESFAARAAGEGDTRP